MHSRLYLCKTCQDIKKSKLRCCNEKTISLGSRKSAEFISKVKREDRLYILVNFIKDGHIEVLSLPSKYKKIAQRINLHEIVRPTYKPSEKETFERSERGSKIMSSKRTAKLLVSSVLSVNF